MDKYALKFSQQFLFAISIYGEAASLLKKKNQNKSEQRIKQRKNKLK